jgi:hypothetical protein
VQVLEFGTGQQPVEHLRLRGHRPDYPSEPHVGPDDDSLGMAPDQRRELLHHVGVLPGLRERHVHVVVDDAKQPGLRAEVEDPVQGGIGQARRLAVDLGGDELLVDGELADAAEDPGERAEDPLDVVHRVHVGRIEARDHRLESRLLLRGQRAVRHGDDGVGEGVVVQRRVGLEIVGGSEVSRVGVRPLLLKRNAEQSDPADLVAHDLQEVPDLQAFLDVVREMEMGIVEFVVEAGRGTAQQEQAGREETRGRRHG